MKLKQLFTDESAVSPVIGVILMVAITVLLSATAASFFLGLAGNNTETPTTAMQFDYSAVEDDDGNKAHRLKINHAGGDTLDVDNVAVTMSGAASDPTPNNNGPNGPGTMSTRFEWSELDNGSASEITAGSTAEINRYTVRNANYADLNTENDFALGQASVSVVWTNPENGQTFTLAEWKAPTA